MSKGHLGDIDPTTWGLDGRRGVVLRRESAITRRQKAALEEKSWAKPVVQPVLKELRKKQLAWERANPSKVPLCQAICTLVDQLLWDHFLVWRAQIGFRSLGRTSWINLAKVRRKVTSDVAYMRSFRTSTTHGERTPHDDNRLAAGLNESIGNSPKKKTMHPFSKERRAIVEKYAGHDAREAKTCTFRPALRKSLVEPTAHTKP